MATQKQLEKETMDAIFRNDGKKGVLQFLSERYGIKDSEKLEELYAEKMKKRSSAKKEGTGILGRLLGDKKE